MIFWIADAFCHILPEGEKLRAVDEPVGEPKGFVDLVQWDLHLEKWDKKMQLPWKWKPTCLRGVLLFGPFLRGVDAGMNEVACALMYYCAFWILFGLGVEALGCFWMSPKKRPEDQPKMTSVEEAAFFFGGDVWGVHPCCRLHTRRVVLDFPRQRCGFALALCMVGRAGAMVMVGHPSWITQGRKGMDCYKESLFE